MNLGRLTLHRMVSGYRKKLSREIAESRANQEQKTEIEIGGKTIPIIIKPIIAPVSVPVQMAQPVYPAPAPIQVQASPQQPPPQPITIINQVPDQKVDRGQMIQIKKQRRREFIEGYSLPELNRKTKMKYTENEKEHVAQIIYPLIPSKPAKGEQILAYAKIAWDDKANRYIYTVVEPEMTEVIKKNLAKVKELLEEKLDVDFSKLKIAEATDYLRSEIDKLVGYYKFGLTGDERTILQYFIERDFMGLGRIEPIMKDSQIEDVSCDGIGIPIFIFHRDPRLGSMMTNVVFDDGDELDSFITKLAQLSGKSVSVADPLLDGSLPDGSRIQATLATDIARKGSNFTIRKFSDKPMTPIHLIKYGTIDIKSAAYLWMAIDYGRSILVSGGTASGKTSFLNALSLFIRPDKKIISIEDTAELRLPHPHWVPGVARSSVAESSRSSTIDMFALLKESLRQRPDYIIVGEVRGAEASVLFQQMATGHPSYATIHAENMDKLVDRLTTAPISLPNTLVGSLDLTVFMLRVRYRDRFMRRINEVIEMVEFRKEDQSPSTNTVFKWNTKNDKIETLSKSMLLKKISDITGMSEQEVLDEMSRRMTVLRWLVERNITEYEEVYKIVNMYYNYPNRILSTIYGEM